MYILPNIIVNTIVQPTKDMQHHIIQDLDLNQETRIVIRAIRAFQNSSHDRILSNHNSRHNCCIFIV